MIFPSCPETNSAPGVLSCIVGIEREAKGLGQNGGSGGEREILSGVLLQYSTNGALVVLPRGRL